MGRCLAEKNVRVFRFRHGHVSITWYERCLDVFGVSFLSTIFLFLKSKSWKCQDPQGVANGHPLTSKELQLDTP